MSDSKWVDRFSTRPLRYFWISFVVATGLMWLILQLLATYNSNGEWIPTLTVLETTSSGVQAVIGTAVVGASAIVALLVALAALRASKDNNALSERSNELTDPDYLLSHNAYLGHRRFNFLVGALLASYRTYLHERDLTAYASASGTPNTASSPRWVKLLEALHALMLDTSFQVASLEAAKELDRSLLGRGGGSAEHMLRKELAAMLAVLDEALAKDVSNSPEQHLVRLLSSAEALDWQLINARQAVMAMTEETLRQRPVLLTHLRKWMGEVEPAELGSDLSHASRAGSFGGEELVSQFFGAHKPAAEQLEDQLVQTICDGVVDRGTVTERQRHEMGIHGWMRVAAICGDHASIMDLQNTAHAFATGRGLKPIHATIRSIATLQSALPSKDEFYILTVNRRTLPLLFNGGFLDHGPRACVFIDGLRSSDLTQLEDELERLFNLKADRFQEQAKKEWDNPPLASMVGLEENVDEDDDGDRFYDMLSVLTSLVFREQIQIPTGDGRSYGLNRNNPVLNLGSGDPGEEVEHPRIVWVGMDYRRMGVEPTSRLDNFSAELWSIFGSGKLAVSEEVRRLTRM